MDPSPTLSFDNTTIAFAYKDDRELRRSYRLYRLLRWPMLARTGSAIASFLLRVGLPVKSIVRRTIFRQFVGGETLADTLPVVDKLLANQVLTVMDYGVEAKNSEPDFDLTMQEMKREIDFAKARPGIPCISCKVTGMARFDLLEKLHEGDQLTADEQTEWQRVKSRIEEVCAYAYQHDMGLYIDAEESWIQAPVDGLVTEMMEKYNREKVVVYNTVQLYLKDRLDFLQRSYEEAKAGNYFYGIKLVRGAYMDKERRRAAKMGLPSPVQDTQADTDAAFDAAVRFCIDHVERISVCVASHNERSNMLFATLVQERGIDPQHPHLLSCQLYGMSDHITFNLAHAGFRASKYLPYGPVKDVIHYLGRRAAENTSVGGQMGRELQLLKREMERRRALR